MSTLHARTLRNQSTFAERLLWARLRKRQSLDAKFRRQHPIGPYFPDFCSIELGIIVEVDGGQHAARQQEDDRRDQWLTRQGYQVLRFWDTEVCRQLAAVVDQIGHAVRAQQMLRAPSADRPHPTSPTR